ncbi:hypothetical protein K435DRAFT_878195 [Dendrothele bispora CBS 962.96]|uniref:Uncharacterized protein n=1 Tax=Dendrothele bispora (strain CBS 962.96) TaxID=1314807 RepID=A0A4S8KNR6_DENBC|nr:hypothetical protein K435DRAFT_878195 [Dendrothele bispora CBS 962.96]
MSRPLFEVRGCSLSLLEFWPFPSFPTHSTPLACCSKPPNEAHSFIILSAEVSAILFVDRGFGTTLLAKPISTPARCANQSTSSSTLNLSGFDLSKSLDCTGHLKSSICLPPPPPPPPPRRSKTSNHFETHHIRFLYLLSRVHDISSDPLAFQEQFEWQLDDQERADVIAMYMHPEKEVSIDLLELGLTVAKGRNAVYGIGMVENLEELVEEGRYNVPTNPYEGYSIEMHKSSIAEYEWPNGSYWVSAKAGKA